MPRLQYHCLLILLQGCRVVLHNLLWIAKENQVFRLRDFREGQFGPRRLFNGVKALFEGISSKKQSSTDLIILWVHNKEIKPTAVHSLDALVIKEEKEYKKFTVINIYLNYSWPNMIYFQDITHKHFILFYFFRCDCLYCLYPTQDVVYVPLKWS